LPEIVGGDVLLGALGVVTTAGGDDCEEWFAAASKASMVYEYCVLGKTVVSE
jgi:hypothetical protein